MGPASCLLNESLERRVAERSVVGDGAVVDTERLARQREAPLDLAARDREGDQLAAAEVDRETVARYGADAYIAKPFDIDVVQQTVARFMNGS